MYNIIVSNDSSSPDSTSFNQAPIGFRSISEKEFAQSKFFNLVPEKMEYRQIHLEKSPDNPNGKVLQVYMLWFHDATGIAIHSDYCNGKVEYFAFGCDHKFHELSESEIRISGVNCIGQCYHVVKCEKCGFIDMYDSSD